MISVQGLTGQTVGVFGCHASVATALADGGATVAKGDASEFTKNGGFDGVARLIVGAEVAHLYPAPHDVVAAAWAAGVPVDNEVGLFFQSFATSDWGGFHTMPRVVGVTGSQGATAASDLIGHIVSHAGRAAQVAAAGVLTLEPAHDGETVVLNLSANKIELARALTPDIAVLTDVADVAAPDHGGQGGYFTAMRRLFAEGGPDRCVINVDAVEGQYLANQMAEGAKDDRVIQVSTQRKLEAAAWSVFVRKGFLSEYRKGRQVGAIDLRKITGVTVVEASAAFAACRAMGLSPKAIEAALDAYENQPSLMG